MGEKFLSSDYFLALLAHLLLHPYISGRQFRLELWSLVAILITLLTNLYVLEQNNNSSIALTLSSIVLIIHIFVILGFSTLKGDFRFTIF